MKEFGLRNVEGAILTGERHILVDMARDYFYNLLKDHILFNNLQNIDQSIIEPFDFTIDCTFCAQDQLR
jgi:hypothetical protein